MKTLSSQPELQKEVQFFEYTSAANPQAKGIISPVPFAELASELHENGPTRVIPFDLSKTLKTDLAASSPNLAAGFLKLLPGESLAIKTNSTSELFYVIRGQGHSRRKDAEIKWGKGDFFVLPGGAEVIHEAETDSALYWVNDAPLLSYLGVVPSKEKFSPTLYRAEDCMEELQKIANDPNAADRNRISVLLGNKNFPQTLTITHTLWAMFGLLKKDTTQSPHRHNSVALDLILDCKPGCYSLISKEIDDKGRLINPVRQDWKPYSAFVTPPYYWHSHHNESGEDCLLIPIQDAGLQTYMRTLNIEFSHPLGRKA